MSVRPFGSPAPGGLLDALRAFGGTLAETACVRGALFTVELREQVERGRHMLLLVALAIVLLHTALVLATFLVAAVFWDTHRFAALGAMAAVYLGCGAAALGRLRGAVTANSAPFAASLGELHEDLAHLRESR